MTMRSLPVHLLGVALAGCGGAAATPVAHPDAARAPLTLAADAQMITVPAGKFIAGSTPEERDQAYDDYLHTAGTDAARDNKWFASERDRAQIDLPTFQIDLMPVTQAQYAEFVISGAAIPPSIDEATWKAQGFAQDFATVVARFNWVDGRPPPGREDHPVVLVTWSEADAFCRWRGDLVHARRRLPTADEFEKAARGDRGIVYPWGNRYDASKLDSVVAGPNDTEPVGSHGESASPYGVLEMAGNVFQWTSTTFLGPGDKMTVKGSAWEDYGGVGRGAGAHGRARTARHVIVGFRCAADG